MGAWGKCEEGVTVSGSRMESKVLVFLQRAGSAKEETVSGGWDVYKVYLWNGEAPGGTRLLSNWRGGSLDLFKKCYYGACYVPDTLLNT